MFTETPARWPGFATAVDRTEIDSSEIGQGGISPAGTR